MVKLFILLTVVLLSSFTAMDLMAIEDSTFLALQDHLWIDGVAEDEVLPVAQQGDYLPEELAVALERQKQI